jgi:hypothetical protein
MFIFKNKTFQPLSTIIFLTSLLVISCKGCKNKTPQRIYTAPRTQHVIINRFDRDLFLLDTVNLDKSIFVLSKKYGDFYFSYAEDVLNMPPSKEDTLFITPMRMLLNYQPMLELFYKTDSVFADMRAYENQFSKAMDIYVQDFPQKKAPAFTTIISEFGYANITYENQVIIGLDMYMNRYFSDFYRAYEFPEFMIRKLQPEYIVPNALKALAIRDYEHQTTTDKRFLAMMIVEGKVRYFMKALQPELHDTLIMGYTSKQLDWCEENENQIWAHFIDKNLLYKNEPSQFIRYFNDGPFTSADGVPPESAPMIGTWTGLQIVRNYMMQNPSVTLKQLMDETDFDKLLKASKYRPK